MAQAVEGRVERFRVLGIDHKTAAMERLEKFALGKEERPALGDSLVAQGVRDVVVLATCNRLEIFFSGDDGQEAEVRTTVASLRGEAELPDGFSLRRGKEAVLHLLRLASGLESMVVGEAQVLGQVKEAWRLARDRGWLTGQETKLLFETAFHVAKKVRTETRLGEGNLSVPSVAVQVLENEIGDLAGRKVLIVGAGATGRLAARHLAERPGIRLAIANRTPTRARTLAAEVGAEEVLPLSQLPSRLPDFDVVVGAVEGPGHVLSAEALGEGGVGVEGQDASSPAGHVRPFPVLIDLSMPPCFDPALRAVPGVRLLDMESLRNVATATGERRHANVPAAEKIIRQGMETLLVKLWEMGELKAVASRLAGKLERMVKETFPELPDEAVARGVSKLLGFHLAKLTDVRSSMEERQARLAALKTVFMASD
jgi:glutamyl-tRNA reductase